MSTDKTLDETRAEWPFERSITAKQYAAIHLRVEHPDIPGWLNEMIRKARRDEFASNLAGVCLINEGSYTDAAGHAYEFADALIAEGKK